MFRFTVVCYIRLLTQNLIELGTLVQIYIYLLVTLMKTFYSLQSCQKLAMGEEEKQGIFSGISYKFGERPFDSIVSLQP